MLGGDEVADQGVGAIDAVNGTRQIYALLNDRIGYRRGGEGGDAFRRLAGCLEGGQHGDGRLVIEIGRCRHDGRRALTDSQTIGDARRGRGRRAEIENGQHPPGLDFFDRHRFIGCARVRRIGHDFHCLAERADRRGGGLGQLFGRQAAHRLHDGAVDLALCIGWRP